MKQAFNPGGAVALASVLYLGLSILLGLVERFLKPPLWLATIIFVPATFALSYIGTQYSNLLVFDHQTWAVLILLYCVVASMLPVWALLQPRGYLGGFVLYTAIAVGVIGIFFGGYAIQQPAFKGFDIGGMTGMLFPFLFVTIACGACSGFHGLVCSGTTSKQIDKESHAQPVGYGGMLAEGFVAFIALVTVMIATSDALVGPDGKFLSAGKIYGNGIGNFLTLLVGKENLAFAITFGAMAFSTFVFDTLDVTMRLGRYLIQELIGIPGTLGALIGTLVTVALPFMLIFFAKPGFVCRILDALRRVEPTARRIDAAVDHGLALQGAAADRIHADTDAFCFAHHALGSRHDGLRELRIDARVRHQADQRHRVARVDRTGDISLW